MIDTEQPDEAPSFATETGKAVVLIVIASIVAIAATAAVDALLRSIAE